jgi:hypothetical protein
MIRRISAMRFWRSLQLLIGVVIFGLAFVPRVRADVSNQKVIFTFSRPVEIPGKVIGPGTYVFRVLDTPGSQNIVQVLDKDETHVIATYITVGEEVSKPYEKPYIVFEETSEGSPVAIRAWFYPGDTLGHEFVYSRPWASELARANKKPAQAMPSEVTADSSKATSPDSGSMTQKP